jgi:type III restriction enzyme
MQGWGKNKIYPDFIFARTTREGKEHIVILETKGSHLRNDETDYKKKLKEICSGAFQFKNVKKIGELELEDEAVSCALVYEENWKP